MSKEIRDGFFMFSLGRLTASAQPEQIVIDMILSFAVESVVDVVTHLRHVVAKAVAVEALSEASILALNKQQRIDGERGRGGHDRLLDGICFLARVCLEDVLECRGVTKRTLRQRRSARTRGGGTRFGRDGG